MPDNPLEIIFPYGQTIECECGKTHRIEPEEVIYAPDAVQEVAGAVERFVRTPRAAVVMDARTGSIAGRRIVSSLIERGMEVDSIQVPDPPGGGDPVCDSETFDEVSLGCEKAECVIAAGSGVLCDLGKWAAFEQDIPFVCFATAASMNGYSSANVAATVNGVKTMVRARPPKVILSSPDVLRNAPYEMTASGLGDVLAKSVSSADWRMNQLLFGDYYCQRANALIAHIEVCIIREPALLARKDPSAIERLFDALLLTGTAMTMAESSAPASGGEHLVSHTLDMMAMRDRAAHDMHGRQVGIGTILASELYRRVLALETPRAEDVSGEIDAGFWGSSGSDIQRLYTKKAVRIRECAAMIQRAGTWDRLRTELGSMARPPHEIRDCLASARAAYRAADIGCSRKRLVQALLHAHEIRDRFTILDLARITGVLPGQAEEIVEEWA
jgi:glycerol-1-phosphate dehydrogenase [NAD(P)+]